MTEEQFWHSNPRIIKVWEKAFKLKQNRTNELIHAWVGNYGISALGYAIDHCLNGRKARTEYMKEPIQLFEKTKEDLEKDSEKARQAFLSWAGIAQSKYKGKGENDGSGHDTNNR